MKKTDKTALTAAIFAAAMGAAAVSGNSADAAGFSIDSNTIESQLEAFAPVYGPSPDFDYTEPVTETATQAKTITPATTIPDPVYGPPWAMTTSKVTSISDLEELQDVYGPPVTEQIETTPAATEPVTVAATIPEFQEVYGPPPVTEPVTTIEPMTQPVYGPMWDPGDANLDGKTDVFDMPIMRKYAINGREYDNYSSYFNADVNLDGEVNVADLVAMSQYLMGQRDLLGNGEGYKIKKNKIKVIYEPAEEVTEPATEEPTNPFQDIPQPKYGPPYTIDDPEYPFDPLDPIEEPTYQAYYGPPSFFGLEDF